MSIEKSELKAAFVHALGCDSDDDLEAAKRDVTRATGRIQAARMLEAEITKIISKLDREMGSDAPPFSQMEDYAKAKHYLGMCLAQAVTVAKASDNLRLQMEGKVMAFQHTIKRLSKIKEAEERKVSTLKVESSALDEAVAGERRARPVGLHPGPPIGALRKAEATPSKNRTNKRKCGNCGELGHTARTCKEPKKKKKKS